MPDAGDGVGQPLVERDTVEAGALDPVVGSNGTAPDLHHKEGDDYEEVFDRRKLRRGRLQAE